MKLIAENEHEQKLVDRLIALGSEIATQDNLATNFPVWLVMERKKVYVDYMSSWDEKERRDPDFYSAAKLCDECSEAHERDELPENCESDMCDSDVFAYFNYEDQPVFWKGSAMFLTQKDCQDHIDSCSYDYSNPRTYAYSAYNNYEMQDIIQALILASGNEINDNHYGRLKSE